MKWEELHFIVGRTCGGIVPSYPTMHIQYLQEIIGNFTTGCWTRGQCSKSDTAGATEKLWCSVASDRPSRTAGGEKSTCGIRRQHGWSKYMAIQQRRVARWHATEKVTPHTTAPSTTKKQGESTHRERGRSPINHHSSWCDVSEHYPCV
jgi:hypothetical protein